MKEESEQILYMIFAFLGIGVWALYILFLKWVKYTNYIQIIIWGFFVISLAVIAYNAHPLWDLSQHFSYMIKIQKIDATLLELCTTGIPLYEHNRSYWLFNFLCYLGVKINDFHVVPFITVLIDYLIYAYITLDWRRKYRIRYGTYILSILICFTTMPLMHATAGIRNANAASLASLSIYLYLQKERPAIYSIILMIAAIFMHPVVILSLPALVFARQKPSKKVYITIVLIILMIPTIAKLFSASTIPFFKRIGYLYQVYSSSGQYVSSRRYLYMDLIIICIFLSSSITNCKCQKCSFSYLQNFLVLYMICILGNIGNYDLIIRPMYIIAPLSTPTTYIMFNSRSAVTVKQTEYLRMILTVILSGLCGWCIWDYLSIFATYF